MGLESCSNTEPIWKNTQRNGIVKMLTQLHDITIGDTDRSMKIFKAEWECVCNER